MGRRLGWRGWMALTVMVAAALACSVEVSTARLQAAALFKDAGGQTRTRNFGPQDTVYCLLQLKNAPDGTAVKAVWVAVAQDQPSGSLIGEKEVHTGNGMLTFEAAPPVGGWPPGDYRVELYLNGDRRQALDFKVK